ncbi:MAG: trimeric intracellular cation channel family protein [Usitatibacter sp.]
MVAWPTLSGDLVLTILEAAAVIVSAIAGMIVAANKGMDIVGAYALACVNAFGGGTVRDLLLDNRPFYWMQHWGFLVAILAICIPFVYSVKMFRLATEMHRRSIRMDAVGLALFTITGVGVALAHGAPLIVAALMGVVTGTMGGVLRDVVVNEMPDLFRPGALYATASFIGALAFLAGLANDLRYSYAATVGIVAIVVLRLLSVRLGLSVPAAHWNENPLSHKP